MAGLTTCSTSGGQVFDTHFQICIYFSNAILNIIRKYSTTDQLAYLVSDVVDQTVQLIIDKEDIEHGFQPFDYIYLLFLNIMANSVFGKKY